MDKHTISEGNVTRYINNHVISCASSHGKGVCKKLEYNVGSQVYSVFNNGVNVLKTLSISRAIIDYNSHP